MKHLVSKGDPTCSARVQVRTLQRRKLDPAKVDEDLRAILRENRELEARLRGKEAVRTEANGPL